MKEIKAIIEAYDKIDPATTNAALATVVRVEGSSYRRTGARMLVLDNGNWVGGISGGCLEGDALKRARLAIAKSVSTLITYDTMEEDDYQVGVGLGCNGIIDVLFTPLDFSDPANPVAMLKSCIAAARQTHVLITITRMEGGPTDIQAGSVIKFTDAACLDVLKDDKLQIQMVEAIQQRLEEHKSAPHRFVSGSGYAIETFIEILPPEINVVLVGFQYDVYPFSRLIKEIGWRVTVVANRQKLNAGIAAVADEVVDPGNFKTMFIDRYTVIILMSHDYKTDKYNLPLVASTPAPYVGLLGPRSRSEKILRELEAEGFVLGEDVLHRLHAPVGLDIGAITPEEIALAMAAEVRAVLSARDGCFLRLRKSTIHERDTGRSGGF